MIAHDCRASLRHPSCLTGTAFAGTMHRGRFPATRFFQRWIRTMQAPEIASGANDFWSCAAQELQTLKELRTPNDSTNKIRIGTTGAGHPRESAGEKQGTSRMESSETGPSNSDFFFQFSRKWRMTFLQADKRKAPPNWTLGWPLSRPADLRASATPPGPHQPGQPC